MRPLSVQPVEPFGFTLYFFAYTDEQPPAADLEAVANRSWTYQRPYTVLEIQHVHDAQSVSRLKEGAVGYGGSIISGMSVDTDNMLGFISGTA